MMDNLNKYDPEHGCALECEIPMSHALDCELPLECPHSCAHPEPEKRSAWTDEQREIGAKIAADVVAECGPDPELTGLDITPERELTLEEIATLPAWATDLRPGRCILVGGWVTRVVLIDPERNMLLVHVEGRTKCALKRAARAEIGLVPKKGKRK